MKEHRDYAKAQEIQISIKHNAHCLQAYGRERVNR